MTNASKVLWAFVLCAFMKPPWICNLLIHLSLLQSYQMHAKSTWELWAVLLNWRWRSSTFLCCWLCPRQWQQNLHSYRYKATLKVHAWGTQHILTTFGKCWCVAVPLYHNVNSMPFTWLAWGVANKFNEILAKGRNSSNIKLCNFEWCAVAK